MTNWFEQLHLPGPDEPTGVIFFGKSPELIESDLEAGIARIGGIRAPNYFKTYLLAADTLLSTARKVRTLDHHSLPIFFLQRHSAELMIKAALHVGVVVHNFRKQIGQALPSEFPSKKLIERSEGEHDLQKLLSDLETMVVAMQLSGVPDALKLAVKEIVEVEQREHTWARYSFQMKGSKEARIREDNLQAETIIPLAKIQSLLQSADTSLGAFYPADDSLRGAIGAQISDLFRRGLTGE